MVLFKRDPTLEVGALSTEDTDLAALGAIFWDIKFQLCVDFTDLSVVYCPRVCNSVAHCLAKYGDNLGAGTCETWLGQLLDSVLSVVAGDLPSGTI